ncbi:ABC transporter permease subunit [Sphingomonas sp. LR61]|uniref:carbohydrate ABC transporter permease n=1 Tax=Sphingomonas sp. LR61 TaxID=3050234 RepID=UPI002FE05482
MGLQNYLIIFQDKAFHAVLMHNGFIVVLSLVLQGPIAIVLALLLNQKMHGRGLVRVLVFVPYVISEVIVGTGWSLMLQSNGAVNDLLQGMGLGGLRADWLSNPDIAIWTLLVIISWKYIGFAVILFLAGLQSIPEELFEAAAIDGAGYWQIQRRITLPLLGPTIRIWAFLSIIGSLQLFDLVYIIWGQYISSTAGTSTMATYMVANGRTSGNFGFGSAVAVVMFVISLAVALIYQRFVLRPRHRGCTHREEELMATTSIVAPGRRATRSGGPARPSVARTCSPTWWRSCSSPRTSPRCCTSCWAASGRTRRSPRARPGCQRRSNSATTDPCCPAASSGSSSRTRRSAP